MPSTSKILRGLEGLWAAIKNPKNLLDVCTILISGPMNYFFAAAYKGVTAGLTSSSVVCLSVVCGSQIYAKYKELTSSQKVLRDLNLEVPKMAKEKTLASLLVTITGPALTVATLVGYNIGVYNEMPTYASVLLSVTTVCIFPSCKKFVDMLLRGTINECQRRIEGAHIDVVVERLALMPREDVSELPPNITHATLYRIHRAGSMMDLERRSREDVEQLRRRLGQIETEMQTEDLAPEELKLLARELGRAVSDTEQSRKELDEINKMLVTVSRQIKESWLELAKLRDALKQFSGVNAQLVTLRQRVRDGAQGGDEFQLKNLLQQLQALGEIKGRLERVGASVPNLEDLRRKSEQTRQNAEKSLQSLGGGANWLKAVIAKIANLGGELGDLDGTRNQLRTIVEQIITLQSGLGFGSISGQLGALNTKVRRLQEQLTPLDRLRAQLEGMERVSQSQSAEVKRELEIGQRSKTRLTEFTDSVIRQLQEMHKQIKALQSELRSLYEVKTELEELSRQIEIQKERATAAKSSHSKDADLETSGPIEYTPPH